MNTNTASIAPIASTHYFPSGLLTHVTAFASDDGEVYVVDHRAEVATHDRVKLSNERNGVSALGHRVSDGASIWLDIPAGGGYFPRLDNEREFTVEVRACGVAQVSRLQRAIANEAVRTITLGL